MTQDPISSITIKMPSKAKKASGSRQRNATSTRQAIFDAARKRFTEECYDHVGVREIAGAAGVDAALVNRYFGSKEKLFIEVLNEVMDASDLMQGEGPALAKHLANLFMDPDCDDGLEPMLLFMRSVTSPIAVEFLRENMDKEFVLPMSKLLGGKDANLRAAMIASYLIGICILREILKTSAFDADDKTISDLFLKSILPLTKAPAA